jgi:hypothetical protein
MKAYNLSVAVFVAILTLGSISLTNTAQTQRAQTTRTVPVNDIIQNWSASQQETAREMISQYGQPNEATPSRLIWFDNGPWKRTILYSEAVPHNFPVPHKDYLEQTINYSVPPEKFDELAVYDGSVIADRTKGELSARCDKQAANFLALNLANDIVKGRQTVEGARAAYAQNVAALMQGEPMPYTQELQFQVPRVSQADPDVVFPMDGMTAAAQGQVIREIETAQPIRGYW